MSKRGSELSEHILHAAKSVFLEVGFERASMDVIAVRAQTSKRTLYAHFESKEKLYLAIIELVREMTLLRIKTPTEYSDDPIEAITLFLGRYLEGLLFTWTIQMCRMIASEADRFPEGSKRYFDVIFTTPHQLLSTYMKESFEWSEAISDGAAQKLIGRLIYPSFPRTLFGMEPASDLMLGDVIRADFDLEPIRKTVLEVLGPLLPDRPL